MAHLGQGSNRGASTGLEKRIVNCIFILDSFCFNYCMNIVMNEDSSILAPFKRKKKTKEIKKKKREEKRTRKLDVWEG